MQITAQERTGVEVLAKEQRSIAKKGNKMELKLCPWCGSSGTIKSENLGYSRGRGYPGCHSYQVVCINPECSATAPHGRFDDIYEDSETARQRAIDAWNLRSIK